ncbi:MAG: aminotransferase class III-fold pyridoxal phosphate-dependent enzyme, partial [Chloroflexi bacterium]|nr:aminotransferase class III-fold pyridoxal phosphate-dependent enzyme [Chloroflexota bacterium]
MSGTTAIDREFFAKHAVSAQRAEEARAIFPGGVTHDARHFEPFGIVVDRAVGPRKWDVDGNEYIDYVMGHGALLFGHSHPYLVEAVVSQVARGTQM